uniref:ATP-binding cassette sub-family C member 10 n=1 Tax=Denticeps clupeoides TaxID=299321 RepID=A0AAY4DHX2_9TELE
MEGDGAGFTPAALIGGLCHTDADDPFPVWQNGTFSPCFNQLLLGSLPHAAIAVFSACFLATPRCSLRQSSVARGWIFRAAAALLLLLLFIGDLVAVALLWDPDVYLDILADGCAIIAWLLHFCTLVVLRRSVYKWTRGPLLLVTLVILLIPNTALIVAAKVRDRTYIDLSQVLKVSRLALAVTRAVLLLMYLLAYVFPCHGDHDESMPVNTTDRCRLLPVETDVGEMVAGEGSSWLSSLLYLWLNPLLLRGQRGELERPDDVYQLPYRLRTGAVYRRFLQCWEDYHQRAAEGDGHEARREPGDRALQKGSWTDPDFVRPYVEDSQNVSLLRVLHKAFGLHYYLLGLLKLAASMLSFAGPLLLSSLVGFMEAKEAPVSRGVWCAVGLFASTFFSAFFRNVFVFQVSKVSLEARAAVVSTIYSKALQVSGAALANFNLGEVVNFMSTDTDRLVNFFNSFHEVWSLPFQFALALYLLYLQVGVAFLGGLGVAILLVPLNKVLASQILENNKHMLTHKDSRVKLMTEMLFGIRVLKFYNWEEHFAQKISKCREQELAHLKTIKYLDAVCVYTWAALPVVISILTFITYVLLGHQLTAAKVFTTLALVGMLILPLNSFPWVLNGTLEAKVSLDRIQHFLRLQNQDMNSYYQQETPEDPCSVIQMCQAEFSWQAPNSSSHHPEELTSSGSPSGSLSLHSLNLTITKGSLVAIVGKVGCGKSSLLAAISGELERTGGSLYVQGRAGGFGLAAQEPWLQHGTVRDNILFGREFDQNFYQSVIEACALSDDLNIFPAGDRTEVGENGVTLSGGQRNRLALARAVYMDKDVYLLDDPLASVDANVAQHLMDKCIMGILRPKTRILCTHRIEFLDKADVVVLMDNGTITTTGTPSEVLPLVSAAPKNLKNDSNIKDKRDDMAVDQEPVILGEERKQSGGLAWTIYRSYWHAVGGTLAFSVLFSLFLMQASKNVSDWWLSHWISHLKSNTTADVDHVTVHCNPLHLLFSSATLMVPLTSRDTSPFNLSSDLKFYMTVYGSIAAANTVFTAARSFLFAYGAICAATIIHKKLLNQILKATVTFFDITPLGRILNRFSSDMYSIDDSLPFILNILLANIFSLLGMLVVMAYGLPWVLLPLLPLGALYFRTQHFYRHTSRELKRLCSLTLSPIYSHFSETLSGLGTIRASSSTERFQEENETRLEQNQRCVFVSNAAMQWLDIRLQMIGVTVVTGISVIAVIQHQVHSVDPGLVGLSLSYALSITNLLSGLIFSFAQMEMQMVSVERTEEYSVNIPTEPQGALPLSWPQLGRVQFVGVQLAYRPGLPNALDGVNLEVLPGERVGIVGRTGSGKSTLFLALFRMVDLNQGQILLDGQDISQVALSQLRKKMAIIPQDPFLFSGTIRDNLDPCGCHSDRRLLDVLDECHIAAVIRRIGGLDAEVGEKGKSLSVGQRQLLCLARALLTEANIVCIDEATSSIDQKTGSLLQQTIRENFREKTILTIAHRINTIMDSDRVLVMHAGKVAEFDTPSALLQGKYSFFQKILSGRVS